MLHRNRNVIFWNFLRKNTTQRPQNVSGKTMNEITKITKKKKKSFFDLPNVKLFFLSQLMQRQLLF